MNELESSNAETMDFDTLLQKFRAAFEAQYRRGCEDTVRRLMAVAQDIPISAEASVHGKKRAPRGTAKILVERVLSTGAHTVKEICKAAASEAEKLLSASAVRLELERGKRDKRYRNQGGKWLLKSGAR